MQTLWLKMPVLAMLLFGAAPTFADVAVLVHGYLADATSWRDSGVTATLDQHGWRANPTVAKDKAYYVVNLPSEAALMVQAGYLHQVLTQLRQAYPNDRMVLIGHSAGGVVARLVMVRHPKLNIHGLLSIAAPHLGTDSAEDALLVSRTPLSWITPMIGAGTLNRSRDLYRDLAREKPGSFLGWLNQQPHPNAQYISIVRSNAVGQSNDDIVPVYSQDMRNVRALKNKAKSYRLDEGHALTKADGGVIVGVLLQMLDS